MPEIKSRITLLSLTVAATLCAHPDAQAANRTWDGNGASDNWSYINTLIGSPTWKNTNWTDNAGFSIGYSLPLTSGDNLQFAGTNRLTPNNDLNGLSLHGLSFASGAGAFALGGHAVTLDKGGIVNQSASRQIVNMPVTLGTNQIWDGGSAGMVIQGGITLGAHQLILAHNTALITGDHFTVGDNGSISVESGSSIISSASLIGASANSAGTVKVTGANSSWVNAQNLILGLNSQATLNIENGGSVSSASSHIGMGSKGIATVDGAGSSWINAYELVVGDRFFGNLGAGTLNIQNGGSVDAGNTLVIARNGEVNFQSGSLTAGSISRSSAGKFNWTGGTLRITGNDGLTLGSDLNAVTMLNNGQTLKIDRALTLNSGNLLFLNGGNLEAGMLALNGGSVVGANLDMNRVGSLSGYGLVAARIAGGSALTSIAAIDGGLTLGDVNSSSGFDFGGYLQVGSNRVVLLDEDKAELGVKTLLGNGGQLEAGKGMNLSNGETLAYTGNASILGNFTNNGWVLGSGGALTFLSDVNGAGSFAGNIVFHAGYNPGNSPAAVNFNGGDASYDASSILTMEILGSTPGSEYDQLLNIDHLAFEGILNLVFGANFSPVAGTGFDLFQFNSFAGNFTADRITVSGIDRALLDFSQLASNGRLQIATVPVPASAWLFGTAFLLPGLARRRKASTAG